MLVVVCVLVGFVAAFWFPHCVPLEKLAQIKKGMAREEVVALLGPPDADVTWPDGRPVLAYGNLLHFRYCTVDVILDSSQHVGGVFHDH